jgi:hypothetical protein
MKGTLPYSHIRHGHSRPDCIQGHSHATPLALKQPFAAHIDTNFGMAETQVSRESRLADLAQLQAAQVETDAEKVEE